MKDIKPTDALSRLHPLSCAFVISTDQVGKPSGMIASWIMQCSLDPPLIAVSIGKPRFTYKLVKDSGEFVIAIPNKEMQKAVLYFGNTSGRDVDKFKETKIKTQKSQFLRVPLLVDATLNYECRVINSVDAGDHSIFIGEVVASSVNEGKKVLLNMGRDSGRRLFEEF